jgi:hypothetical protein
LNLEELGMRHGALFGVVLLAGILLVSALAPSARAATVSTATITDPSVDVKSGTPAWLDLVSASVSAGKTGNFSFDLTVASAIPSPSVLASTKTVLEWWFCLQVNSSFTSTGWPGPTDSNSTNGNTDPCQYFIALEWIGTSLVALTANRTPELTGGAPILTIIPFSVQSATILWSVDRSLIGSPSSFGFLVGTETEQKADFSIINSTTIVLFNGNSSVHILDLDGASGGGFARWP